MAKRKERDTNLFELKRYIPENIRREVRQRCGFGCVFCGVPIYDYEHFAPPFYEAKEHLADGITLLCANHHAKKTRRWLTGQAVAAANANPKARQQGFVTEAFHTGPERPGIVLGNVTHNGRWALTIKGDPIIGVEPPEDLGGPFRLSAFLSNKRGDQMLRIDSNEWRAPSTNWDLSLVGTRIRISNSLGDVALVLRHDPPNNLVVVEKLGMYHRGVRVACDELKGLTFNGGQLTGARISNLILTSVHGEGGIEVT